MKLKDAIGALKWYMYEKGLERQFAFLQAFSNAGAGSGVTLTGSTFGDLDLAAAADVSQTPTGITGLVPGKLTYPDPGANRSAEKSPTDGFRQ